MLEECNYEIVCNDNSSRLGVELFKSNSVCPSVPDLPNYKCRNITVVFHSREDTVTFYPQG